MCAAPSHHNPFRRSKSLSGGGGGSRLQRSVRSGRPPRAHAEKNDILTHLAPFSRLTANDLSGKLCALRKKVAAFLDLHDISLQAVQVSLLLEKTLVVPCCCCCCCCCQCLPTTRNVDWGGRRREKKAAWLQIPGDGGIKSTPCSFLRLSAASPFSAS